MKGKTIMSAQEKADKFADKFLQDHIHIDKFAEIVIKLSGKPQSDLPKVRESIRLRIYRDKNLPKPIKRFGQTFYNWSELERYINSSNAAWIKPVKNAEEQKAQRGRPRKTRQAYV